MMEKAANKWRNEKCACRCSNIKRLLRTDEKGSHKNIFVNITLGSKIVNSIRDTIMENGLRKNSEIICSQNLYLPERCPTLRIAFSPMRPNAPRADLAFSSDIVGSVSRTLRVTTSVAVAS